MGSSRGLGGTSDAGGPLRRGRQDRRHGRGPRGGGLHRRHSPRDRLHLDRFERPDPVPRRRRSRQLEGRPPLRAAEPRDFKVLQMVLDACRRTGTPVTLCGEMAGQPRSVLALFGMGLRRFSMSPAFVPAIERSSARSRPPRPNDSPTTSCNSRRAKKSAATSPPASTKSPRLEVFDSV